MNNEISERPTCSNCFQEIDLEKGERLYIDCDGDESEFICGLCRRLLCNRNYTDITAIQKGFISIQNDINKRKGLK